MKIIFSYEILWAEMKTKRDSLLRTAVVKGSAAIIFIWVETHWLAEAWESVSVEQESSGVAWCRLSARETLGMGAHTIARGWPSSGI